MNVLIPCFNRPAFLWHCLDNITKAQGAAEHHYIFRLDHGYDPKNLGIIEAFPLSKEVTYTPKTKYTTGKQSFSVLSGLMYAGTNELVYLIEDDVMIARDFFLWHEAVHAANDLFSSHANFNVNSTGPTGFYHQYYLTQGDYSSIGTCLTKKAINAIAPHIRPEYFSDPTGYIKRHFPDHPLSSTYSEQDGLIRRLAGTMAYPCQMELDGLSYGPRCFHAGFVGKNRPTTSAQMTPEYVGRVIYDQQNMRVLATQEGYYLDSRPVCLDLPQWTKLQRKD